MNGGWVVEGERMNIYIYILIYICFYLFYTIFLVILPQRWKRMNWKERGIWLRWMEDEELVVGE